MWWMHRVTGLIEFSALSWVAFAQQNPNPPQSVLDNPVTLAALLSLLAGALIHFIPRIATAIVKVIEALAGIVEEYHQTQKAKRDAMTQYTQEMKSLFDRITEERARADKAELEVDAERARTNAAVDAERERATKAIEASIESLRLANAATAQLTTLTTAQQKEADARHAAEVALETERKRAQDLEIQLAAMNAWIAKLSEPPPPPVADTQPSAPVDPTKN